MNVQELLRNVEEDRVVRMEVREGSSVLLSWDGGRRGVSWERGYTIVFSLFLDGEGRVEELRDEEAARMRGVKSLEDWVIYSFEFSSGDGAEFEEGQVSVYPAGNCGSGLTRKLREETALCSLEK